MIKYNINSYLYDISNKQITSFEVRNFGDLKNFTNIQIHWEQNNKNCILIVDIQDDKITRKLLRINYKRHGYIIDRNVPKFSIEAKESFPIENLFFWENEVLK